MQVNRCLENKDMDHIDHALGRPINPMVDSFRNYFYVCGDTELRKGMTNSPNWEGDGKGSPNGEYFTVTTAGRAALATHLRDIKDPHRLYVVSYDGYHSVVIGTSQSNAKYSKWLNLSDVCADLTFSEFLRKSKARLA